eukprot:ctg_2515.g504
MSPRCGAALPPTPPPPAPPCASPGYSQTDVCGRTRAADDRAHSTATCAATADRGSVRNVHAPGDRAACPPRPGTASRHGRVAATPTAAAVVPAPGATILASPHRTEAAASLSCRSYASAAGVATPAATISSAALPAAAAVAPARATPSRRSTTAAAPAKASPNWCSCCPAAAPTTDSELPVPAAAHPAHLWQNTARETTRPPRTCLAARASRKPTGRRLRRSSCCPGKTGHLCDECTPQRYWWLARALT